MADVLERDAAGFCSGCDEYEMEGEDEIHSPTDASEDSIDIKVRAISFRNRNKRKCAEPRKLDSELPAKKRKIDLKASEEAEEVDTSVRNPFRPWSASPPRPSRSGNESSATFSNRINLRAKSHSVEPTNGFSEPFGKRRNESTAFSANRLSLPENLPSGFQPPFHRIDSVLPGHHQSEPLSLVSKRKNGDGGGATSIAKSVKGGNVVEDVRPTWHKPPADVASMASQRSSPGRANDRGSDGAKTNSGKRSKPEARRRPEHGEGDEDEEEVSHRGGSKFGIESLLSRTAVNPIASTSKSSQGGQQRNYKNMTRERRIEANARERTRVHTISAAFDTLRHSIPAYSHNQKLSKLSVLRIACSYIVTLSRLAGRDYSRNGTEPDLSDCVENVSKTIQTEGKIRKKREE